MSSALPGADVRGFYHALGIELADWAQQEASVACFADPDAHARQDRDASCSVNVEAGVWRCHGCGAAGGPYDAATARGRTPREAMELLVSYGLAERHPVGQRSPQRRVAVADSRSRPPGGRVPGRVALKVGEPGVVCWGDQLARLPWPPRVLRPAQRRVWSREVLLGLECGRITIPIRNGGRVAWAAALRPEP